MNKVLEKVQEEEEEKEKLKNTTCLLCSRRKSISLIVKRVVGLGKECYGVPL